MSGSRLFSPFTLRDVEFRNRVFVSPMCQYSSRDGAPTDWHLVHLGSRAVGGAGLVLVEATAVTPEGRISPDDSGIWEERHVAPFRRIAEFVEAQGAVPFAPDHPVPRALEAGELDALVEAFAAAAIRARDAGFKVVELHAAHGYLLHEFLSPLSNRRDDEYGGSLENRARFPLRVVRAVREAWPDRLPLFVRISATDWVEGGWDPEQSIRFSVWLKDAGVDLVDCSSGGLVPDARIPAGPGYQTVFAERIRREAGTATGTVGMITDPVQAEHVIRTGQADAVLMAREFLRDPYWPLRAARELGADVDWPRQYERARR